MQKKKRRQMQTSGKRPRLNLVSCCSAFLWMWESRSSGDLRKKKGMEAARKMMPMTKRAYYSYQMTMRGPMSPPTPKKRLTSCTQQSLSLTAKRMKMQRLVRTVIMQTQAPAMQMLMDWFQKPKLRELSMRVTPHASISPMQIWWQLQCCTSLLTRVPPIRQPRALARKMNEKQVSSWPVTSLQKMMMGPRAVESAPQSTQTIEQAEKRIFLSNIIS